MPNNAMIDEIMGFSGSDLNVFQPRASYDDANLYKTNPKNSKSEDGNYHSKIRILLNPKNPKSSILPVTTYWLESSEGKRLVKSSLSNNDTNCPIFQCWRRNWYKADENRKNELKTIFQRNESRYALVQVLEDNNQPEMVGKVAYMKLAKDIYDKLADGMNPSPESGRTPYPMMDYVIGKTLEMNVKPGPDDPSNPSRKQRETSYGLCSFSDYAPIIKTDGTNLFSDDEIDLIDTYYNAFNDSKNGKTQKKKDDAKKKLEEIRESVKVLYEKAINYINEILKKEDGTEMDLEKDMGYQPWDDATTQFVNNWITVIDAGQDPKTTSAIFAQPAGQESNEAEQGSNEAKQETDGDLPF